MADEQDTATPPAFTPGPWVVKLGAFNMKARDASEAIGSIEGGDYWLAEIWSDYEAETPADLLDGAPPKGTALANAHVMAASPDLYTALAAMVETYRGTEFMLGKSVTAKLAAARAALAKAEGR
jgi:hypothetical protein